MLWIEEKYISLLSPRLKLFKRVKNNQWVFRCPICGDSKKNAYKTRGGIYLPPSSTSYVMGCFNCGASMSFVNFLKLQDSLLHQEFLVERYQATNDDKKSLQSDSGAIQTHSKRLSLKEVERISDLGDDHPAVKYIRKRKIPETKWDRLYFVLRFKKWEIEYRKTHAPANIDGEHSRLIIPYFDKSGNIIRISARAFGNEEPKYIFIKVKDDASRVYGIDTVDTNRKVRVVEGPLDSLFLDNSVAIGSADLVVPELQSFSSYVLIPDNQPRNPEVCKSIKKMIDAGHDVCLWQDYWGKDINDMIKNGKSKCDIQRLIDVSTFSGIRAKLEFSRWVKTTV